MGAEEVADETEGRDAVRSAWLADGVQPVATALSTTTAAERGRMRR